VFFRYIFDGQECFINLTAITRADFIPGERDTQEVRIFFGNSAAFLYLTREKAKELRELLQGMPPKWALE